jgi:hypothetical protein
MNPLSLLLALVRAIYSIAANLLTRRPRVEPIPEPAPNLAFDSAGSVAARRRRREYNACRRARRARRRCCRHGRPTRCGPRSRCRRIERPVLRRPASCSSAARRQVTLVVRRSKVGFGWEVRRKGSKRTLLTARSALAAMARATELLEEEKGGGNLLVCNSTGRVIYGVGVCRGWCRLLTAEYLPAGTHPVPIY